MDTHRFEIYSRETLVGWTALERGDPPMGCAFGRFFPSSAYLEIRSAVVGVPENEQSSLHLSVRVAKTGELLKPVGGVSLIDISDELGGEEGRDVFVYGVGYPRYAELFPEHLIADDNRFKKQTPGCDG
jgi:hypothetical protein